MKTGGSTVLLLRTFSYIFLQRLLSADIFQRQSASWHSAGSNSHIGIKRLILPLGQPDWLTDSFCLPGYLHIVICFSTGFFAPKKVWK